MADSGYLKRRREDDFSSELDSLSFTEESFPEAKRLRADDLFIDILDDDSEDAGEQELADVMKSLEEEIGLSSPSPTPLAPATETPDDEDAVVVDQPDIGYLFEASDDDLGLPPSVPSSSDEAGEGETSSPAGVAEPLEEVGFGQIWGFDDEIHGFDGFEFGMPPLLERAEMVGVAAGSDDGLVFDGGLFEYADVLCGPLDLTEFSWRSESLPAV